MNIAVFIKKTTLHKGFGGLETQNKYLCEGLTNRGHNVWVFSPKYELDTDSIVESNIEYKFVKCSFRSLAGFDYLDKNNWTNCSYEEFKKLNSHTKIDLVISQSSAGLGIIRRKKELGVPVLSICHGTTLGEFRTTIQSISSTNDLVTLIPKLGYYLLNFFGRQREFVLHSDRVVAVSKYVMDSLIEETFITEEKISVIHNGIDLKNQPDSVKKEMWVTYAGLIHWSKGLKDLVLAVKNLKEKDFQVQIAGDGPHLEDLKEFVQMHQLSSKIIVHGKLPYMDTLSLMEKSSVFVLPSKRVEGFPMSIVEAMMLKLPVIASNIGGISEGVLDKKTGLLYKSGNIKELESSIDFFISNPSIVLEYGTNGYNYAVKNFSLGVMLDRYEKIFEEVLK